MQQRHPWFEADREQSEIIMVEENVDQLMWQSILHDRQIFPWMWQIAYWEVVGLRIFWSEMFCGSAVRVADCCGRLLSHVHNLLRTVAAVIAMYGYELCNYLGLKNRVCRCTHSMFCCQWWWAAPHRFWWVIVHHFQVTMWGGGSAAEQVTSAGNITWITKEENVSRHTAKGCVCGNKEQWTSMPKAQ